jgi:SNF2 family DNA or RNA helicase
MKAQYKEGIISMGSSDREFLPDAETIFAVMFEGQHDRGLDLAELRATGLQFSGQPATPVLRLTATSERMEGPIIRWELAGRLDDRTIAAATRGRFVADYIVAGKQWHPLPLGINRALEQLRAKHGITGDTFSLGQYIKLLRDPGDFEIEDLAAGELAASKLSPRLETNMPAGITVEPYAYQKTGIRWLGFLAGQGVGCILADEMGLGKTLQIVGTLLSEANAGRHANLVVCPATLLENWRREITRFAPALRCLVHAGSRRTGRQSELSAIDVVVASYETVVADIFLYRSISWNLVVLDEAQNIRNPSARRTLRCKELPRRVGIAVTGTPMENRLLDLWSIADFAVPGYLGTQEHFESVRDETQESAKELEPLVSAIMLRRLVSEVAKDLPERIDVPVPLALDQVSAVAYEEIREEAARTSAAPGLTALVRLRLFCSHPWAAGKFLDTRDPVACSPKLERCLEILEEIVAAGEKALVFTSYNETSDLIQQTIMDRFGIPVRQINGALPVPERQPLVDTFAATAGAAVLVLNPKAGGTGLNITAANHVIHFNLEWNPAVEDQASARSHRRGQQRPVTVHRLYYVDTVEQVISERMERKRQLAANAVIGASGTEDDLADIVKALQRSPLSLA